MDHLEGRCDFPVQTARYVVDHYGTMENGPVLVLAWHILICETGAGHLDESTPGSFKDTFGALSFGRG